MKTINPSPWFVKLSKEWLPVQNKTEIKENLKHNWYIPISAMAYFCLSATLSLDSMLSLIIVFIIFALISTQISPIKVHIKNSGRVLGVVSFITAIGICFAGQSTFYSIWSPSVKIQSFESKLPIAIDIPLAVGTFGAVAAIPFVFFCLLLFWNRIKKIAKETKLFCQLGPAEWIVYGLLLAVTLGYMVFTFAQSQAFYATDFTHDVIYTSDSPTLVKGNAYLALRYPENDIRQPLFAVFAAPFVGIPYLLSRLINASATVQAILMNSAQVLMLLTANFMLAKMLQLDSMKRICFMVLSLCTYTYLLFSIMMEQYIVAYFWLIFCMYLITEKDEPDRIALWGAGGSLLTSVILLPLMPVKSPIRNFKSWFMDTVKYGLEFIALMLAFCRFDVIYNLAYKYSSLNGFTGKNVPFADKIYQYTEFIRNCFLAPPAHASTVYEDHVSWWLNTVDGINIVGVLIFVIVVFSAFWNRDKKSSLLAAGWVGFSVIMLLVIGWGTQENGLILYSLYFGWAFLVLLFQLVEKIESKLNVRFLIPIFTVCAASALLIINIPAIAEMVNFAITYYPV